MDDLQNALERIRQAACRDKRMRFTALWHHVYNIDRLRGAYYSLKRSAAPGVDGETWANYGQNLEENLLDLSGRLQRGAYRAKPVKRGYIPKPDGRKRPLGITALEDKIEHLYVEGGIYKNVSVNVTMTAKVYYVQGEVNQPGQFQLVSGTTLLQAIASARGYTPYANKKKVTK